MGGKAGGNGGSAKLLLRPGIVEFYWDTAEVASVARDKGETVDGCSGREQSINDGARAIAGPFAPESCRGRIDVENVARKADLYPFNPR